VIFSVAILDFAGGIFRGHADCQHSPKKLSP
jgi:hypothetical protein